jgi:putative FmdB family regulatory protein
MPLYDYGCPECGTEKEVQHTVSEIGKIEVLCDLCRKPMKKLLSIPALIGFDNIGRSGRKKDNEVAPTKDTGKKAESPNKIPTKADAKKDTAA